MIAHPGLAAVVFLGSMPLALFAQNCGGTERWSIKMGADPGAAQVVTTPVARTLHDLIQIQKPSGLNLSSPRTAAERVVYVVDGRLMKFKKETGKKGDADFHLVISDETQLYSTGEVGSVPSPHSFVAEIPDPTCVAGRDGLGPTPSRFAAQLQNVRTKFLAEFPTVTSKWKEAGGIPVRLTGVTFFDKDHRQVGRSIHGLELHPLLDIDFGAGLAPLVQPIATTTLAMNNPGFENGPAGWTATADVITLDANEAAHSGQWKAWLGGHGTQHTDKVSQDVTLPAGRAASLTFYLHIDTQEAESVVYDRMRVRIRDANGNLIKTLKTYSNLNASDGFESQSFDLSAYAGQTIRISLEATEDSGSETSFVVDDFTIVIEPS